MARCVGEAPPSGSGGHGVSAGSGGAPGNPAPHPVSLLPGCSTSSPRSSTWAQGWHSCGGVVSTSPPPPDPLEHRRGGGTAQGRAVPVLQKKSELGRSVWDGAEGFLGLHTPGGPHVSVPAWDSLPRARGFCLWLGSWGSPPEYSTALSPLPLKRGRSGDIQGFQPWPHLYFGPDNFFCGVIVCL